MTSFSPAIILAVSKALGYGEDIIMSKSIPISSFAFFNLPYTIFCKMIIRIHICLLFLTNYALLHHVSLYNIDFFGLLIFSFANSSKEDMIFTSFPLLLFHIGIAAPNIYFLILPNHELLRAIYQIFHHEYFLVSNLL